MTVSRLKLDRSSATDIQSKHCEATQTGNRLSLLESMLHSRRQIPRKAQTLMSGKEQEKKATLAKSKNGLNIIWQRKYFGWKLKFEDWRPL